MILGAGKAKKLKIWFEFVKNKCKNGKVESNNK